MAIEFLPLLMKDLQIVIAGTKISRLALNRHMPKVERIRMHDHPYDQFLLYLRGSGIQVIGDRRIPVRRGALVFLRKQESHGFRKEKNRSPVCLAIDLDLAGEEDWPVVTMISGEGLLAIERIVHDLARLDRGGHLQVAAGVLGVVQALETELRSGDRPGTGKYFNLVRTRISGSNLKNLEPTGIARGFGMSLDYLNRQLKREANTSVGRILSAARFEIAGCLLRETSLPIGEVAWEIGMVDQNYFSRWFRKQSGLTPSQWRRDHAGAITS